MSSIYKKGRDGYFYYQAYVYNPESKKKDKRVFHALRTKSLSKAKLDKDKLDIRYQKEIGHNSKSSGALNNLNLKLTLFIIVVTISIAFFMIIQNFRSSTNNKEKIDSIIPRKIFEKNEKKPVKIKMNSSYSDIKSDQNKIDIIIPSEGVIKVDKSKKTPSKVVIPIYNVEQVEKLSDAFDQIKVSVTISSNSSEKNLLLICRILKKEYNEFSNILICLYADNIIGKNLAEGKTKNISTEEQKKSWLAMYTFNSVEGEYFDDSPSTYLGNY